MLSWKAWIEQENRKGRKSLGSVALPKEGSSNYSKGWLRGRQEGLQGPKDSSGNVKEIFGRVKIFVRTSSTHRRGKEGIRNLIFKESCGAQVERKYGGEGQLILASCGQWLTRSLTSPSAGTWCPKLSGWAIQNGGLLPA